MKKSLQIQLESKGYTGCENFIHAGPNRPQLCIWFEGKLIHTEIVPEIVRPKAWGLWMVNRFHNFVKQRLHSTVRVHH